MILGRLSLPIDYFFNDILGIKDRDTIAILQNMIRIIHFKKNEIIFNMGERPDMLAFLNYGVTRGILSTQMGSKLQIVLILEQEALLFPVSHSTM